jgi:hypothetical protein
MTRRGIGIALLVVGAGILAAGGVSEIKRLGINPDVPGGYCATLEVNRGCICYSRFQLPPGVLSGPLPFLTAAAPAGSFPRWKPSLWVNPAWGAPRAQTVVCQEALSFPMVWFAIPMCLLGLFLWRGVARGTGKCLSCGHELEGERVERCPECGARIGKVA